VGVLRVIGVIILKYYLERYKVWRWCLDSSGLG
jgi:hypothetical protein